MANIIKKILTGLLLLTVAIFSAGCGGDSNSGDDTPVDEVTALAYTKEAFTYTFPLVYMHLSMVKFTNAMNPTTVSAPINQFSHSDCIGDANYGDVANVNRDVVCSQAFLDLSRDAVVFTKPATERFCVFELFDAYTNCVATMGTGTSNENTAFLITGPYFSGSVPAGMTEIKVRTNLARLIGFIRCDSESELDEVAEIQKQIDAKELDLYLNGANQPYSSFNIENQFNPLTKLNSLSAEEYFNLANELMVANPPADCDSDIMNRLKRIKVGPGKKFDASIFGDSNSYRYFESIKQQCMSSDWTSSSQTHLFQTTNYNSGLWSFYTYGVADYGTEYDFRAFCAYKYVCAHPNTSCLIVTKYKDDTADSATLKGSNKYKLVFQNKQFPPLMTSGFWSITAYNAKTGLIQTDDYNTVYSIINDKSNISENASGTIEVSIEPVSASEKAALRAAYRASRKAEEESSDDSQDDTSEETTASATASLPIYDTSDNFFLILRIYLPHEASINGFWAAPIVKLVEEESE